MPVIVNKKVFMFSSEDPKFPARNLLETKVTKKWKCKDIGEKSCFVVLKLDQPRLITGIDIGNEWSGFIEVLVGNSLQAVPEFKEILIATSFMTIIEAQNGLNPNRVRCFNKDNLVESVAKEKWDLVKIVCQQIYNSRNQYGLSFVTLHTSEAIADENSPEAAVKPKPVTSSEKRKSFGKFMLRAGSSSESDGEAKKKSDNSSPFDRWKASKSGSSQPDNQKPSIKDQVKAKIEQNRKRIRVLSDSSDEEQAKAKSKPNRNRTSGLLYEDEDDEPNEKLQKKMDKDREARDKSTRRDKSPPRPSSTSKPSKFASFISDDPARSSQKSSSSSSSKSKDHKSSSSKSPKSSHHSSSKSPRASHSKSTPRSAEKKSSSKSVTYKPFHKLLEGVTFVLSGYVNPERGTLRQKALDMGAKYKQDWDSSCTHLICAVPNTPKYQQVKGKGKIVGKQWIIDSFSEQKRLPWRRYSIVRGEKDESESEDEIHNVLNKPKSPSKSASKSLAFQSDSDDDMVVVDKRVKNGTEQKADNEQKADQKTDKPSNDQKTDKKAEKLSQQESSVDLDESDEVQILPEPEPVVIDLNDSNETNNNDPSSQKSAKEPPTQKSAMDVSTDDELMEEVDPGHIENQVYKSKAFFLNDDLPATDVIKLNNQITAMEGRVTGKPSKADYIVTKTGHKLPQGFSAEVVTPLWVYECYELGAQIPTNRYKIKVH